MRFFWGGGGSKGMKKVTRALNLDAKMPRGVDAKSVTQTAKPKLSLRNEKFVGQVLPDNMK